MTGRETVATSSTRTFSTNGAYLETGSTGFDIWAWPVLGDRKPFKVVHTPLDAMHGRVSPDGKWMAYASDESGEFQIYVQPFPPTGDKKQISSDGGSEPRWRRDGTELFYLAPDRQLMAVQLPGGRPFDASAPKVLLRDKGSRHGQPLSDELRGHQRRPAVSGQHTRRARGVAADQRRVELAVGTAAMRLLSGARLGPYEIVSLRSAPAAWARSTRRATRGSIAPSRSRSCRANSRAIPICARGSSAKRARSRRWIIRTSARSTTSASRTGTALSRHAAPRGRDARRAAGADEGSAAARPGAEDRDRDRRRARQGAPRRHHASRSEAREHHADEERARSCSTSAWRSCAGRRRRSRCRG